MPARFHETKAAVCDPGRGYGWKNHISAVTAEEWKAKRTATPSVPLSQGDGLSPWRVSVAEFQPCVPQEAPARTAAAETPYSRASPLSGNRATVGIPCQWGPRNDSSRALSTLASTAPPVLSLTGVARDPFRPRRAMELGETETNMGPRHWTVRACARSIYTAMPRRISTDCFINHRKLAHIHSVPISQLSAASLEPSALPHTPP